MKSITGVTTQLPVQIGDTHLFHVVIERDSLRNPLVVQPYLVTASSQSAAYDILKDKVDFAIEDGDALYMGTSPKGSNSLVPTDVKENLISEGYTLISKIRQFKNAPKKSQAGKLKDIYNAANALELALDALPN